MTTWHNDFTRMINNGFFVLPCRHATGFPQIKGWNKYCLEQPKIEDFSSGYDYKTHGFTIATGASCLVIDLDTDDDDVRKILEDILPESPIRKRGTKGYGAFYRGDPEQGKIAWEYNGKQVIELLGVNCNTAFPPTVHRKSKKPYTWLDNGNLLNTKASDLPVITQEHIDKLNKAFPRKEVTPRYESRLNNDSIFSIANIKGLQKLSLIIPNLGLYRCTPTSDGYKAVATWRPSGASRPLEKRKQNLSITPRGIVDFGDNSRGYSIVDLVVKARNCSPIDAVRYIERALGESFVDTDLKLVKESQPPEIKPTYTVKKFLGAQRDLPDIDDIEGILPHLVEYCTSTSPKNWRDGAFLSSMVFLSACMGGVWRSETNIRTNMYVNMVAASGYSKSSIISPLKALGNDIMGFDSFGDRKIITEVGIRSDSAMARIVSENKKINIVMDEFGSFLQKITSQGASSHLHNILADIRRYYSCSNGFFEGHATADETRFDVKEPCLSLTCMTTPKQFWSAVEGSLLEDGTMARFLMFHFKGEPEDNLNYKEMNVKQEYLTALTKMTQNDDEDEAKIMPFTDDARELYIQFGTDCTRARRTIDEAVDDFSPAVINRMRENAVKISMVFAFSENHENPVIGVKHFKKAIDFVKCSANALILGSQKYMFVNQEQKNTHDVRDFILNNKKEFVTHTAVVRNFTYLHKKELDSILTKLESMELIDRVPQGRGFRYKKAVINA